MIYLCPDISKGDLGGEVTEWLKVLAWKACVLGNRYRGFESLSLRGHFLETDEKE